MIRSSFIFLDGVGYTTEKRLWSRGITCWDDFLDLKGIAGISRDRKTHHDQTLEAARSSMQCCEHSFFSSRLKKGDHWRLYPDFKEQVCFLDIETTGLGYDNDITVVGVYDGVEVRSFVKGDNLSEEALSQEFSKYSLIVSFYGSAFDVPFIKAKYPNLNLDLPHMDLCFASRKIGLRGGLKSIEREIGLARDEDIAGVDGFEAVRLWRRWERRGDKDAFARLLDYNRADVVNLETLADIVYKRLWEKTFTPDVS
ncbi:hypothetical protein BMS3Bbin16_00983 [archaeon BMS3Bbin16]|nr:hypothetical protein BMS3Bbin16_00983 [archaeon BMS3Bbin16]